MRYLKPIRVEMYAYLKEIIEEWCNEPGLYLCMESDEVWQESIGWSPKSSEGLASYLDKRALNLSRAN